MRKKRVVKIDHRYIVAHVGNKRAKILDTSTFEEIEAFVKFNIEGLERGKKIVVGDFVDINKTKEGFVVIKLFPRKTVLSRVSPINKNKILILASNIDYVLIMASVTNPQIKQEFILRCIVASRINNIKPIIIINKKDLLNKDNQEEIFEFIDLMKKIDIDAHLISSKIEESINEVLSLVKNKLFVFVGQSGVGKSSIAQKITNKDLYIGELNKKGKGRHKTSSATAQPTINKGICIDTPGIRTIDLDNITKQQLVQYFPQISEYYGKCKYRTCMHLNTPGCKVEKDINNNKISKRFYNNYLNILQNIKDEY